MRTFIVPRDSSEICVLLVNSLRFTANRITMPTIVVWTLYVTRIDSLTKLVRESWTHKINVTCFYCGFWQCYSAYLVLILICNKSSFELRAHTHVRWNSCATYNHFSASTSSSLSLCVSTKQCQPLDVDLNAAPSHHSRDSTRIRRDAALSEESENWNSKCT